MDEHQCRLTHTVDLEVDSIAVSGKGQVLHTAAPDIVTLSMMPWGGIGAQPDL
jgi:hypothetical protein